MRISFDSSAITKRYVEEAGSELINPLLADATTIGLSVLVVPEVISGLNRKLREGGIDLEGYTAAKACLIQDVQDVELLHLDASVELQPGLPSHAVPPDAAEGCPHGHFGQA